MPFLVHYIWTHDVHMYYGGVNFDHIKVVFAVFLHSKVIVSLCSE